MTPSPAPHRVAARIRHAREQRGLSHHHIAEVTKLSPNHLRALEEDRVGFLPTGIYRRSLVRVVAREVGMDPEEVLRDFLLEHPDDLPPPGASHVVTAVPVTAEPAGTPWRRMFGVLGGLVPR